MHVYFGWWNRFTCHCLTDLRNLLRYDGSTEGYTHNWTAALSFTYFPLILGVTNPEIWSWLIRIRLQMTNQVGLKAFYETVRFVTPRIMRLRNIKLDWVCAEFVISVDVVRMIPDLDSYFHTFFGRKPETLATTEVLSKSVLIWAVSVLHSVNANRKIAYKFLSIAVGIKYIEAGSQLQISSNS